MMNIENILKKSKIIPVIMIHRIENALPLAQAIYNGGINVLEITLRTPIAIEAIRRIIKTLPDCKVAAGTITTPNQFAKAKQAGAHFSVSPGTTTDLIKAAQDNQMPYLPGVTTCSEILQARERGFYLQKFFPAEIAGGPHALKSFASLFQDVQFCPTGGINEDNFKNYLMLPNVFCVGGSWLAPSNLIESEKWDMITQRIRNTINLL